jgi:hypothetical protein
MYIRRQEPVWHALRRLVQARNHWQREKEKVEFDSIRLAYIRRPMPFVLYL